MQFQVPQFIETEDKIIGPLTLKQFFYLAVPAGALFLLFFALQLWLWVIVASLIGSTAIILAFGRVNGRPMPIFIQSAFSFLWGSKTYTFRPGLAAVAPGVPSSLSASRASRLGGLKSLIENLATSKTAIPKRERPLTSSFGILNPKEVKERYEIIRRVTGESEVARRVDYR